MGKIKNWTQRISIPAAFLVCSVIAILLAVFATKTTMKVAKDNQMQLEAQYLNFDMDQQTPLDGKEASVVLVSPEGNEKIQGNTEELLTSVSDKVRELPCERFQLPEIERSYKVGNVAQRHGRTVVRLVGDNLPSESQSVGDRLTLEDVYLYYLGEPG